MLLADIVGFGALAGELVDDVATAVVDDLWRELDAVVAAHGGHIDPHVDDALMAVWGIGAPHDSDPERAVRCALELQRALSELGRRTRRQLAMRVGINTGPVVVTEVDPARPPAVIGSTVEVASHLERAAPMGGIVVGHETYRNVRGVFDVAQLDPLRVSGEREPLRTYAVLDAKPRAFRVPPRGVHGVETRTIGRDAELGTLRGMVGEVLARQHARLVTVVGPPGIGKSRLLHELDNWIELHTEFIYYFKGRAQAHRRATPYGLLRDVMAERCEILDTDPPATVLEKLQRQTSPALAAPDAAALGVWLGFHLPGLGGADAGAASDDAGRRHLATYLLSLADDSPVMWLLEDLHWADDESLDVIEWLVTALGTHGFLVVASARPELVRRRPSWRSSPGATVLPLDPLADDQAGALVNEILRPALFVPEELRQLVVARAGGLPIHIEELLKLLVDNGVIDPIEGGTWIISLDRLERSNLPTTLTDVLRARLDALPGHALAALQHAAVVGREFWDGAVAALAGATAAPGRDDEALDLLLQRELVIRRTPPTPRGTGQLAFQHALLHDVAYQSVPAAERARQHALVARWLELATEERRREHLGVVAEHLELAGDHDAAAARRRELARGKGGERGVRTRAGGRGPRWPR